MLPRLYRRQDDEYIGSVWRISIGCDAPPGETFLRGICGLSLLGPSGSPHMVCNRQDDALVSFSRVFEILVDLTCI